MPEGVENAKFLASSNARVKILQVLCQHSEMTEHELRNRVDCSRTTVKRNLDALQKKDWIQNSRQTYSITTCGEIVAKKFFDLTTATETTTRLRPFLRWVPRDELDIDILAFRDAELTVGEPGNPLAMVNQHVNRLQETERDHALLPIISLHGHVVAHRRMLQGNLDAELVVSQSVAETLCSDPDYAPLTEEMLDTGHLDIYVYEDEIPYYLGILDETVQIGADEGGKPRALIETTSNDVQEWAKETYNDYRQSSHSLSSTSIEIQ